MAGWGRELRKKDLGRVKKLRQPAKRCLIVCEGEKTEPNYFKGLKNHLRLSTLEIKIVKNDKGTDPLSVVNKAHDEAFSSVRDDRYDAVFCVFDRDSHATFEKALAKIKGLRERKNPEPFHAIYSVPCFEYWILLHFDCPMRPYLPEGSYSPCALVEKNVHRFLPDYEKGLSDLFLRLGPLTEKAVQNARTANKNAERDGFDAPSTRLPDLLEILKEFFPQKWSENWNGLSEK